MIRGAGHLAEALLDRADVELIAFYNEAAPLLEERGVPFRRFDELLSDALTEQVLADASRRIVRMGDGLRDAAVEAAWPQYDATTWEELRRTIVERLRTDLFEEIVCLELLRRWAREMDLRLVVTPHDMCRDTKTLVFGARRLGVPSLHVIHGVPWGAANIHDALFADRMAVYNEHVKDLYASFGVPRERMVVTGNPEWDVHARPPTAGYREMACSGLGIDPTYPIVVYALSFSHYHSKSAVSHPDVVRHATQAVVSAFSALAQKHDDWQFVLRRHPGDPRPPEYLESMAKSAGLERVWIDNGLSAVACLAIADVLVCVESNLGIEAILAGKPVVTCLVDEAARAVANEGFGRLFGADDAVLLAGRPEEIAPAVEAALLDAGTRRRFLERRVGSIRRLNHANDGKATARVCALALEMIEHGAAYVAAANRYPEFELALAACVPSGARRILIVGRGADYVGQAIASSRSDVEIETRRSIAHGGRFDAVVVAAPLPHTEEVYDALRAARGALESRGVLVAACRHGAGSDALDAFEARKWAPARPGADAADSVGEYTGKGLEDVLSRTGFRCVGLLELTQGLDGGPLLRAVANPEDGLSRPDVEGWAFCAVVEEAGGRVDDGT